MNVACPWCPPGCHRCGQDWDCVCEWHSEDEHGEPRLYEES